jgi:hypothetical protein
MLYRMMIGATALAMFLTVSGRCMAAGAVALGQPSDIAKDGVAIYTFVNARSPELAKERAMAGCKNLSTASTTSRALCKIASGYLVRWVRQVKRSNANPDTFKTETQPDSGKRSA